MKSCLHEHKYLWRACSKRETIVKAWKKLRKGKTKRREVIKIEKDFDHYVDLMIETLQNTKPGGDPEKAFKPRKYVPRIVNEHGKNRTIYCPRIWEQWVHHIIIQVLSPIVMKYSYPLSCGSMPNKGGVYGKRHLMRAIKNKGFKYYVKLDIRHFFNNTQLDVVINELNHYICDEWFIYLLRVVFKYFKKGLPLGFYISQWLANFVLTRLDHYISKQPIVVFIRYMDDYVIGGNNKKFLHTLIMMIGVRLQKLRLKLKRNYQVIRFIYQSKNNKKKYGREIDFMGFLFDRKHVIFRERIMLKSTRFANKISKLPVLSVGQAQGMLSRLGWFKHTCSDIVFKNYIQDKISIAALKRIVRKDTLRRLEECQNGIVQKPLMNPC